MMLRASVLVRQLIPLLAVLSLPTYILLPRNANHIHFTTTTSTADPPLRVFYNIYINHNTFAIVEEQIRIIGSSYAAAAAVAAKENDHEPPTPLTIYYITIGNDQAWDDDRMSTLCSSQKHPLTCVHWRHYHQGYEEVTLQHVYDYCERQQYYENADPIVVYVHTKGALVDLEHNHNWRKHLTKAVTSRECLSNLREKQCSTCSLQFLPLFAPMHAGNMFTAQCRYILRLVPPRGYAKRADKIFAAKPPDNLQNILYGSGMKMIGLGRHAMEEWAATHPSIIPCDLSQSSDASVWFDAFNPDDALFDYDFHRGMRHNFSNPTGGWYYQRASSRKQLERSVGLRMREEHLLPGLLWKWHHLYPNQFPEDDSWVWDFYPDGPYWKRKVKEFRNGVLALEEAWKENPLTVPTSRYPPLTVFYNIYVSPDDRNPFTIVEGQLRALGASYAAEISQDRVLTIYYNTIGNEQSWSDPYMEHLCSQQEYPMSCIHLNHYSEGYEEVTLQSLYDFCTTEHSSQKGQDSVVIYVHNKGSYRRLSYNDHWRAHLIKAVTSRDCLSNLQESQCSTCSLQFVPLFAMMNAGNFFAAQCHYIRRLVPPVKYTQKAQQLYTTKPRQNLRNIIYRPGMSSVGVGRYAMAEWSATHPSIVPCDLSKSSDISVWLRPASPNESLFDFAFHAGVRHNFSNPDGGWYHEKVEERRKLEHNRPLRLREEHLLPGLLWKWHEPVPGSVSC